MNFNHAELGAILAGLRLLQRAGNVSADIAAIQNDDGLVLPLDAARIDTLCERLNTPEPVLADDADLEGRMADFMRQRIEDGEWDDDDIPVRLARFGLMQPENFVAEMNERIEDRKAEAAEDDDD